MAETIVSIKNLNLHYGSKTVLKDLDWTIERGDCWILSGHSGSGKTSLVEAIAKKKSFLGEIVYTYDRNSKLPALELLVASWYQFTNLEGDQNFYYQQRYNHKQAKDTLTVSAELEKYGLAHQLQKADLSVILDSLNFTSLSETQLIELSSGEHKKLQLVKALWLKPQLLIIDQPYTGLDAYSRFHLNAQFAELNKQGVTLILVTNDLDLPPINHRFATIENQKLVERDEHTGIDHREIILEPLPSFLSKSPNDLSQDLVEMNNVNIQYGEKQVLNNISWKVQAGERWLLQGHNGSGKSTLLSLLNGDHPQAYANDIRLFGKQRGSGESIWDIKKRIGLISPEMHWYFDANYTVWQSIASGLFDTIGLFQEPRYAEKQKVNELVSFFGLEAVKHDKLATLPLGKQRLTLLARTIIKNPELLILDEPCQGLDQQQTQYFNQLVDQICTNGMTLIYVGHFETALPNCLDHRLVLEKGSIKTKEEINTSIEEIVS